MQGRTEVQDTPLTYYVKLSVMHEILPWFTLPFFIALRLTQVTKQI